MSHLKRVLMTQNRFEMTSLFLEVKYKYSSFQDFLSQEDIAQDVERVIVDKKLLLELFEVCQHPGCGCLVDRDDVKMHTVGAAISISATCTNSHTFKWSSSAKVGHGRRVMFVINIIVACYVLLCGLNIERVCYIFIHFSVMYFQ